MVCVCAVDVKGNPMTPSQGPQNLVESQVHYYLSKGLYIFLLLSF
jgi:hypothetical protein